MQLAELDNEQREKLLSRALVAYIRSDKPISPEYHKTPNDAELIRGWPMMPERLEFADALGTPVILLSGEDGVWLATYRVASAKGRLQLQRYDHRIRGDTEGKGRFLVIGRGRAA